jgi:hypothetical protein
MPFSRVGGLAALCFAVLIISLNVILVPAGLPLPAADTAEVVAFFTTHRALVGMATSLAPAAWVAATLFAAGAGLALWRSDRGRAGPWAIVGAAGMIMQNAVFTGVIAARLAVGAAAAHGGDAIAGLWALNDILLNLNSTFLAITLVGLSVGGLRARLIRAWHGGWGLLAAVLLFASATLNPLVVDRTGTVDLVGLVGWLMWVCWIVAYGVTLVRLPPDRRPSTAGPR